MSDLLNEENQMNGMGQGTLKYNVFLGIIGAIIGGLLGSVIWILLNQIGIIAAIAGIAIAWCANKGYSLLTKGSDMKAAVISTIIALLIVSFAHYLCWGIDIFAAFSGEYEITFIDAFLSVPAFAFDPENIVAFLRDLAIGYVTVFLGASPFIRKARNNSSYEEEMGN